MRSVSVREKQTIDRDIWQNPPDQTSRVTRLILHELWIFLTMHHLSRSLRRWLSTAHRHVPKRGDRGVSLSWIWNVWYSPVLVVVGMSGGVDSSVTARLLADEVRYYAQLTSRYQHSAGL